jgi:hypothetical protein
MPVERIERREPVCKGDFWDHPTSFYGRIIDQADGDDLARIEGMSGGPLFSIERTPEGRMKFRLFGVQSSWLPEKRIIRAESLVDFANILGI